jgi:hypothetical protein
MTANSFYIGHGMTRPAIAATLQDASGAAVAIQGKAVTFHWSPALPARGSAVSVPAQNLDDGTTPNRGQVAYAWDDLITTTQAGRFLAYWEVDFGSGLVERFPSNPASYHVIEVGLP